jgi:protein TonB
MPNAMRIALVVATCLIGMGETVTPVLGQTPPVVYTVGKDVSAPILVKKVEAEYTPDARRAQIQGTVILEVVISSDGTVGSTVVIRSLDSLFGLDQQARSAVQAWRFKPALRGGKPVAVRMNIDVEFRLRK